MTFRLFIAILRYIPCAFLSLITFLIPCHKHPERKPLKKRYKRFRKLLLGACKALDVELEVSGFENLDILDDGAALLVSNHLSTMDVVTLVSSIKNHPLSFISKKENKTIPLVGMAMGGMEVLSFNRDDPFEAVKIFNEGAKRMREENLSYAIYPEGTRNKKPFDHVGPFKPGALKMAYKAKAPIIPVATFGTFRPFSKEKGRSFLVQIKFLKPYPYESFATRTTIDLSSELHDLIDGEVEKMKVIDQQYFKDGRNKKGNSRWWRSL